MKVNGRWISAAFILAVAAFVGHNAWNDMPGREKHEVPAKAQMPATTAVPVAK
jgi:predicted negative regulator of RcsB-dependent stress response